MQISEIRIRPVKTDSKGLIAFASCVVDDWIYLGSIGVITKLSGEYRLLYPTKKVGNVDFHHYHPINKEASKNIENALLAKVRELFKS